MSDKPKIKRIRIDEAWKVKYAYDLIDELEPDKAGIFSNTDDATVIIKKSNDEGTLEIVAKIYVKHFSGYYDIVEKISSYVYERKSSE